MEDNNISPEERLLRLIRVGHKRPVRADQVTPKNLKANRTKQHAKEAAAVGKSGTKRFSLFDSFNFTRIETRFSFEQTKRVLIVGSLLLFIFLIFDFIFNSSAKIEARVLAFDRVSTCALEFPELEQAAALQPLSFYTKSVNSRDIFTATSSGPGPKRATPTFMDLVATLRLQGIITGPNPQAVIENTKTKKTYFLTPGEFIGEIELKQILEGKVTLSYHGQEADLSL